jgi:hypothetical protein
MIFSGGSKARFIRGSPRFHNSPKLFARVAVLGGRDAPEKLGGRPVELGDTWVFRKGDKVARCSLVTHPPC